MEKPTPEEVAVIRKFMSWGAKFPGFPYGSISYWLTRWEKG